MICSHCGVKNKAKDLHRWDIALCADGRRKRVFRLCTPCDIALNRYMLRVMGDKNIAAKMAKYETKNER